MNSNISSQLPRCLSRAFERAYKPDTTGEVESLDTQTLRKVTSKLLADRYPVKGSMPLGVVQQLYQLRGSEVERLSQRDVIVVTDLQGMDRGARAGVAATLFEKCDGAARHALVRDEHPHVGSCAVISQSDLQSVS